jgi:hypothetical protein
MAAGPRSEARAELAAVLEPVWPGRVRPYPVPRPRPVAGVYIDALPARWDTDDLGGLVWIATFGVQLVADGAPHAAAAMLDDLEDQTYRAVATSERFYPAPVEVDADTELAGRLFTVRVGLDVRTWCAVDLPEPVTIPPVPVGV